MQLAIEFIKNFSQSKDDNDDAGEVYVKCSETTFCEAQ